MSKKIMGLLTVILCFGLLLGYQNCAKQKFSKGESVKPYCTDEEIRSWYNVTWQAQQNVKWRDLSVYGNEQGLYPYYHCIKYSWSAPLAGTSAEFCSGKTYSACKNSASYNMLAYLFPYVLVSSQSTIPGREGRSDCDDGNYNTNVIFEGNLSTPGVKVLNNEQNAMLQITLASRYCTSHQDSHGQAFLTGVVDFDTNPYLPNEYSPDATVTIRCLSSFNQKPSDVSNTCYSNNQDKPPVKLQSVITNNERYSTYCNGNQTCLSAIKNYDYNSLCNGLGDLKDVGMREECGKRICQAIDSTYAKGVLTEVNGIDAYGHAQAICFRDLTYYKY